MTADERALLVAIGRALLAGLLNPAGTAARELREALDQFPDDPDDPTYSGLPKDSNV